MSDVVVIGAGAAGLVAALAAARAGADVALLERGDGNASNLAISGGLIAVAGSDAQAAADVEDGRSLWLADIDRATGGGADPVVADLVARHAGRMLERLQQACGAGANLIADIVFPGHSVPRLHDISGFDGKALSQALRRAVEKDRRIAVAYGMPVEDFVVESHDVVGVVAGGVTRRARSVVLAAGGYGANRQILAAHAPEIASAQYIGSDGSDGHLLQCLVRRGAPLRDMGGYQGHGHATVIGTGRLGAGLTTVGALLVNLDGSRFVNEETGPSGLAAHVGAQPKGRALEIYTQAMHEGFLRFSSYDDAVARGAAMRFETLEDLCGHHGVDADAMATTLAAFNATAVGTSVDPLGRRRFNGPVEAPFWAVEVTAAMVHTQGGLTIDADTRIIGANGSPIGGLYGAGGAVVGLTGNSPSGYLPGHGLAQSATLGMLAGEAAAAALT